MGIKLDRLFWLLARRDENENAGTLVILILICTFFPILSLFVAWHVMNS